MHEWLLSFLGGLLLGCAAVGYLYLNGRIAGISGIISQVLFFKNGFKNSALWFFLGLLVTPFFYAKWTAVPIVLDASPWLLILSGLLVGIGTRLGSGCTSGHGICGLSRLSKRSMVATSSFMLIAAITVLITRHVIGG
ncbi:YeeE/YedE family protein [Acinetobacter sp.]|uniref:YeeE/YedE family protein n=1 Tax=Acinetobacter sp. TaxID=472 RepID=UPI0031DA7ABF